VAAAAAKAAAENADAGESSDSDSDSDDLPLCVEEKGNFPPGYIEGRANPHVGQTDAANAEVKAKTDDEAWATQCEYVGETPSYQLKMVGEKLSIAVELPRAASAAELDFEVSESEMEVEGHGYGLKLAFTKTMDEDSVTASFDKACRVLKISVGFAH